MRLGRKQLLHEGLFERFQTTLAATPTPPQVANDDSLA